MKKYIYATLAGIIITPLVAFSWGNIKSIWASPEKLQSVEKKVEDQSKVTEDISKLVLEQKTRTEQNEAVQKVTIEALKEQLSIIADLKKNQK